MISWNVQLRWKTTSGATSSMTNSVTIANTNPTVDVLTLNPAEPTLNDTLSWYAGSIGYRWGHAHLEFHIYQSDNRSFFYANHIKYKFGDTRCDFYGFKYDDVLTCTVTAEDARGAVSTSSTSVTIVNTSPVFDQGAVISPTTVELGTTATCSAVASDPDDGVASLSYIWSVNGTQVATGAPWQVNSTDASVGDSLTCTAVAIDFDGNTTTSTSVASTISNTAPVVSGVFLNDLSPYMQ